MAGALGGLDEIGQHELDLRGVIDTGPEAGVGGVIVARAELEDAARVVGEDELVSLALAVCLVGYHLQQGVGAVGLSAPGDRISDPTPQGCPLASAMAVISVRMGATTVEVPSSHVAMVSHPGEVAQLIKTAAEASPAAR